MSTSVHANRWAKIPYPEPSSPLLRHVTTKLPSVSMSAAGEDCLPVVYELTANSGPRFRPPLSTPDHETTKLPRGSPATRGSNASSVAESPTRNGDPNGAPVDENR